MATSKSANTYNRQNWENAVRKCIVCTSQSDDTYTLPSLFICVMLNQNDSFWCGSILFSYGHRVHRKLKAFT